MNGPTAALASFVAETPVSTLPPAARRAALLTVADSFGAAIVGASQPSSDVIRSSMLRWAAPGGAFLLDHHDRVDALTASSVNTACAHAMDYDSISFSVSGFVGSAVAFALTAMADEAPKRWSGAEVLSAYIFGWEGGAALGRAVNPAHYAKGWHPSATLAGFAAALGASRLLGLDAERTGAAIAVSVAEASGVKTMIGNMANAWHVGKAARNGLVAAHLAADGFVGHDAALEAPMGFFNLFAGHGGPHPDALTSSLGTTWDLVDPGPILKVYPCCGLIHSALDSLLVLREQHQIDPADVDEVEVLVHEYVPSVMHVDVPNHGYEAKFSIPYCIATTLLDGRCDLGSFNTVRREVVELGKRVRFGVHPDLHGDDTFLAKEFSTVRVSTKRGQYVHCVKRLENRGTGVHLRVEDVRTKFIGCLQAAGWWQSPDEAWARVSSLDDPGRPWDLWGRKVDGLS